MDYPLYKENWMVEGDPGQCGIACVMWVLNYFWYTNFDKRDTWNMMQMMKKWSYRWNQDALLTEDEIWLNLAELWFDVTMCYTLDKERWVDFVENPTGEKYKSFLHERFHKYIDGDFWVDPNSWYSTWDWHMTTVTDTTTSKKILQNPEIKKIWQANVSDVIKEHQKEWVLFILWVDSYVLYEKEQQENDPIGGHIIVTTGIENDNYVIFDPGPAAWYGYKKNIDIIQKAVNERWDSTFIIVTQKAYDETQ